LIYYIFSALEKSTKFPLKLMQYFPPYVKHITALHRQVRCPGHASRAGNACFISIGFVATEQPRSQFGQLQNMERRPCSKSVSRCCIMLTNWSSAFCMFDWHRPEHHWKCNWPVAWASSSMFADKRWTLSNYTASEKETKCFL